jgi:G:T-mismatch repair DNA endonuclease (very short patch repair protein)
MKTIKLDEMILDANTTDKQKYQLERVKKFLIENGKDGGGLKYQTVMINVNRMIENGVDNAFIERLKRSNEIGAKATLKKMVVLYGKYNGLKKWESYCKKQSESNTLKYKREKYGWSEEQFEEYNKSRSITLDNLIKRHGKVEGLKKWESYRKKQSYCGCSLDYFKEKYGKEEGSKIYKSINWKKSHCLDFYIWKYGREEGLIRFERYFDKLNNNTIYSKMSQKFFWLIYSELNKNDRKYCHFGELNKEFGINDNGKYYFYDFVLSNKKICIEFNGDYWHANPVIYKPDEEIRYPQKIIRKAREIWEIDKNKNSVIMERGYKVYIIWERNYILDVEKELKNMENIING